MKKKIMKFIKKYSIILTITGLLDLFGCCAYIAYANWTEAPASITDIWVTIGMFVDISVLFVVAICNKEFFFKDENEEDQ